MSALDTLRFVARHPLNRPHPLHALARMAAWQLGSRLLPGDLVFGWLQGALLLVKPGRTGLTGNVYRALQEYSEMAYLLHVLRPGNLFVDVGANLGSYTVLAAAVVGADVICIEPVPETFAQLEQNVRINRVDQRTQCVNAGVGRERGFMQFSTGLGPGNHVVALACGSPDDSVTLPITTLDLLMAGRRTSLIKIDVEGFETAVIAVVAEVLAEPSLHSVIMELNGSGGAYDFDEASLLTTMHGHGFCPHAYDPLTRTLRRLDTADPALENCIFIRDLALAAARVRAARHYRVHGSEL
ncbi:MAG: FkbM family methyltransferase [Chloroflexota bacterium]|nr:FkbM family methyltransferase [Chloroflexota bacterium]